MKIVTALGNEELNNEIRAEESLEIIGKDFQYQEALIEILEKNIDIDLLVLNSIIPGELKLEEFINIIKYKKPKIEIFIILEKKNKKIENFLIAKEINNIYYNNKNTFNEILIKIKEKNNKKTQEKKEKIFLEKTYKKIIKNNYLEIKNRINCLKNKIAKKTTNKKIKNNEKILGIIGATKIGKTVFTLILGLNIKNKKILIIDFNSTKNNMKIILGKKIKNNLIKWKRNIDMLFLEEKNNQKFFEEDLKNFLNNYDYILVDINNFSNKEYIFKKLNKIILLVEPNIIGMKETKEMLENIVFKQKIKKNRIKIIYNKKTSASIIKPVLNLMFSDFEIMGTMPYDKNYERFINTNTRDISNKIKKEYLKIIKKIK